MLRRLAMSLAALALSACLQPPHIAPSAAPAAPARLMDWPDLLNRPRPQPTYTLAVPGALAGDLWLPSGEGPFPVVLMIHGGCWQKHIADRTIMNYAAAALSAQGFAVWNIEYRGVDEVGGGYPGTFQDVARAADALVAFAPRYRLDLNRIVGFGHSAGGHLIAWLAARRKIAPSSPLYSEAPLPLRGVVMAGGLADLHTAPQGCAGNSVPRLLGQASPARRDVYADTSPSDLLPLGVPQIAITGEADTVSPPAMAQSYAARASAAGDRAQAIIIADAGHVEEITPATPAFARVANALRALIAP